MGQCVPKKPLYAAFFMGVSKKHLIRLSLSKPFLKAT